MYVVLLAKSCILEFFIALLAFYLHIHVLFSSHATDQVSSVPQCSVKGSGACDGDDDDDVTLPSALATPPCPVFVVASSSTSFENELNMLALQEKEQLFFLAGKLAANTCCRRIYQLLER